MKFKRMATNRGFTLVELLLVIVLIAILMALVTLSGFNMMESTNAQTEARRIIRTVHALRSAWLACYADTQKTVGVPEDLLLWPQASIDETLKDYSDRPLRNEKDRYGEIKVRVNSLGQRGTYIGFAANTSTEFPGEWSKKSASLKKMIMDSLIAQADDYELHVDYSDTSNDVYIRIK